MRIVPEESPVIPQQNPKICSNTECVVVTVVLFCVGGFIIFTFLWKDPINPNIASLPRFSIEAVTASFINFSSTATMPKFLSAQNLTIDFTVENPATHQVEYRNLVASISYQEEIIWLNTLGLYHQEKKGSTSIQVAFGNLPVKITEIDNTTNTSGYGIFTVQVKGKYKEKSLEVSCGDVKINFTSSTNIQGDQAGSPIKCITEVFKISKLEYLSTATKSNN